MQAIQASMHANMQPYLSEKATNIIRFSLPAGLVGKIGGCDAPDPEAAP